MSSPEYQARPDAGDGPAGAAEVALGVLVGDDPRVLGEPDQGLGADRDAAAAGDVVEHDRQAGGVGDGREVPVQALLRGLVVVRRDGEQAVGARLLGRAGQLDAVAGVVGADAGDDVGAVADRLQHGSTSSAFSASLVVGDSPVVPLTIRPSLPASTRWVASRWAPSRSSAPSAVNGVTMAVRTRPKGVCGVEVGAMGTTLLAAHRVVLALGGREKRDKEEPGTACSGVQAVPGPFDQPR